MTVLFKLDRTVKERVMEDTVVLAGTINDDRTRVHVSRDIWAMILGHFQVGEPDGPAVAPPEAYDAVERIAELVIARRGKPLYGLLTLALD